MSRTHILFSLETHHLRGRKQKHVLIKQIHLLNSDFQAALMISIKAQKPVIKRVFLAY